MLRIIARPKIGIVSFPLALGAPKVLNQLLQFSLESAPREQIAHRMPPSADHPPMHLLLKLHRCPHGVDRYHRVRVIAIVRPLIARQWRVAKNSCPRHVRGGWVGRNISAYWKIALFKRSPANQSTTGVPVRYPFL